MLQESPLRQQLQTDIPTHRLQRLKQYLIMLNTFSQINWDYLIHRFDVLDVIVSFVAYGWNDVIV